jgi:MFS family permease
VLFEIPAGFLADKYFGEKEMLIIGLFIIFLSSILFSLIKVASPLVWAAVLFFSRIGAALVESMRDTYFFKKVSSKDIGFINIFRMTNPIGYATGTAFGALFLLFLPINYLFLVFAILITPAFYFVAGIKDTK